MNKITLIGNLTNDPETRSTPSGVTVCGFTIAVNRRFANSERRTADGFLPNQRLETARRDLREASFKGQEGRGCRRAASANLRSEERRNPDELGCSG
jgi:Single-stranded DNA-binding protein